MSNLYVYVDESGCQGLDTTKTGTQQWFVLSAVVVREASRRIVEDMVIDFKRKYSFRPLLKPLHFKRLSDGQRLDLCVNIANLPIRLFSVVVKKTDIKSTEAFGRSDRLYFYATKLLLERVSWFCKNFRVKYDAVKVVFSRRSGMEYEDLSLYIKRLIYRGANHSIENEFLEVLDIFSERAGRCAGLQVADAVATSVHYAHKRQGRKVADQRFALALRRVMYVHDGKLLNYGVKYFPCDFRLTESGHGVYRWLRYPLGDWSVCGSKEYFENLDLSTV